MEVQLGGLYGALATALPRREVLVWRDQRVTWAQLHERSLRLADVLHRAGLGCSVERSGLAGHECGQDRLAISLRRGVEHVEAMLGALHARVAPCNVNPRFGVTELRHLLRDAGARAVVVDSPGAAVLGRIRADLPDLELILQVADGREQPLLPGARWYHEALAEASPVAPPVEPSPDDVVVLYTGGTTGRPKGVLWRQADLFVAALGGLRDDGEEHAALTEVVEAAVARPATRAVVLSPMSHGTGQWAVLNALHRGGTAVLADHSRRLDGAQICRTVQSERAQVLQLFGDASARMVLDAMATRRYDLSSLSVISSGGAPLSAKAKDALLEALPAIVLVDGLGASETGGMAHQVSSAGSPGHHRFRRTWRGCVLSETLDRRLQPGDPDLGWLAVAGRTPLGFLGDPEATARTYRVIDGVRHAVSGDRARLMADRSIEYHGRDATTVNSAGEKIFVEEVAAALLRHPDVRDAVALGRPSERWGEEVVALVALRPGTEVDPAALVASAGAHLARFKLPKAIGVVGEVRRHAGKVDLGWARRVAAGLAPLADATATAWG